MSSVYADTNFFTRVYLQRPESDLADKVLETRRVFPLPMTWLLHCEIINALEQSVFLSRTLGQPRITPEQAAIAQASLAEDLQQGSLFVQSEIPIAQLRARFQDLCFRHTAKHGFRTYDLLHVSSALALGCDGFWSFDAKARKLARFEGLKLNG